MQGSVQRASSISGDKSHPLSAKKETRDESHADLVRDEDGAMDAPDVICKDKRDNQLSSTSYGRCKNDC